MNKKILITGANGLCGNAFRRLAKSYPEHKFIFVTREDYNLTNQGEVHEMFYTHQPHWVIHAAGKTGGVKYNYEFPDELFYENTIMNTMVLHYAKEFKVEKLVAFISTCSFPADVVRIEENLLHLGPPHHTNTAYAESKRALDVQINSYRKRCGLDFYSIIPSNLFGSFDNFDIETGHVVGALINKCYKAIKNNGKMEIWGNGSQLREFLYVDDLAKATLQIMHTNHDFDKIIVSNEKPISIKEIANAIAKSYELPMENLIFDTSKPSGLSKRSCNTERFIKLVKNFTFTELKEGINQTATWFNNNHPNIRG